MTAGVQGSGATPAGDAGAEAPVVTERRQTLTVAMRREILGDLAREIGAGATVEGDRLMLDAGQGVALEGQVEPDGTIVLTWWMTATAPQGHPRWRNVAAELTGEGEAIYTSALGGGFLVEVTQQSATAREAARLARSPKPVERVRALIATFPERVAALPPEPVPEYLLPEEQG